MKNSKIGLGLFSLFALFAVSVFFTSCAKEEIQEAVLTLEEQIDNSKIPEGRLSTELDLRDEANPLNGAIISVSTNNEAIFAQLTPANFKAEVINSSELENSEEDNTEDVDREDVNFDESLLNTDEHFFSMKIIAENINEDEFIKYTFGDELLAVLKKYKAQTHIQVSSEENNSPNSRYSVWRNYFRATGDGGAIPTKLYVRYNYHCTSSYYGRNTNYGFYNYYNFHSCRWPWTSSSRKRYSYFTVIQDVLKSYSRANTNICGRC